MRPINEIFSANSGLVIKLETHPNFALIWLIMLVNDSDYRLNVFLLLSYSYKKLYFMERYE